MAKALAAAPTAVARYLALLAAKGAPAPPHLTAIRPHYPPAETVAEKAAAQVAAGAVAVATAGDSGAPPWAPGLTPPESTGAAGMGAGRDAAASAPAETSGGGTSGDSDSAGASSGGGQGGGSGTGGKWRATRSDARSWTEPKGRRKAENGAWAGKKQADSRKPTGMTEW